MPLVLKRSTARDLLDRLSQPRGQKTIRRNPTPLDSASFKVDPHSFRPSKSSTAGKINISAGSWYMNNAMVTDSGTDNLGSSSAPYIVATLTMGTANPLIPTAITISAQAAAATSTESATKRNLCKGNYNGAKLLSIDRFQVGDIHQNLNAIQDSGGWDDGTTAGTTRPVITRVRWDPTTKALQYKGATDEVISGVIYMGKEDAGWTDFADTVGCATTTT